MIIVQRYLNTLYTVKRFKHKNNNVSNIMNSIFFFLKLFISCECYSAQLRNDGISLGLLRRESLKKLNKFCKMFSRFFGIVIQLVLLSELRFKYRKLLEFFSSTTLLLRRRQLFLHPLSCLLKTQKLENFLLIGIDHTTSSLFQRIFDFRQKK